MGATVKNKRKIHVNGRDFYWRCERPFQQMTITTPDKKFIAFYKPEVHYGAPMWIFTGKGSIEIKASNIPELQGVEINTVFETPDWSDIGANGLLTPKHIRRVIVYIFETLM